MSKPIRILLLAATFLGMLALCTVGVGRSRDRVTLAKYKAQLRAQGELLTFADLDYPRPPLTNDCLPRLLAAAERLQQVNFQPGLLTLMEMAAPGQAKPCWAGERPAFKTRSTVATAVMGWAEFTAFLQQVAPALAELREALTNVPPYLERWPTNWFVPRRNPIVEKRAIALWFSADTVAALHEGQLARAQADLHTLLQMVELHREEPTLVNQMTRTAIASQALAATWEALCAKAWTEESLAALQRDWEQTDLVEALKFGVGGERTLGGEVLTLVRSASSHEGLRFVPSSRRGRVRDAFSEWVVIPLWRLNADRDELFYLQHYQNCLDSLRKLNRGVPWPAIKPELAAPYTKVNRISGNQLVEIDYWFSNFAIVDLRRSAEATVHVETQRRLTVTAIALERYRLRTGCYPPTLEALVPRLLSAVPIDLMSAEPLRYRLNTDGSMTLYSAGEDGHDDGGDPTSATAVTTVDLWSGRDAVWPQAMGGN